MVVILQSIKTPIKTKIVLKGKQMLLLLNIYGNIQ